MVEKLVDKYQFTLLRILVPIMLLLGWGCTALIWIEHLNVMTTFIITWLVGLMTAMGIPLWLNIKGFEKQYNDTNAHYEEMKRHWDELRQSLEEYKRGRL